MVQDFKKLEVWNISKDFCLNVYKVTSPFPKEEQYGITTQLRRAAVSIGANIAEGCGRSTNRDFNSFLYNALGSAKECEYLLLLCRDLTYISDSDFQRLNQQVGSVSKMLNSLIGVIKAVPKA